MKTKTFTLAGLCASAIALALPTAGVGAVGPPLASGHGTIGPFTTDMCGIDGTTLMTVSGITKVDPTGATLQHGNIAGTFTSSTSGKSIDFHTSETEKTSAPIDHGDGTLTFLLHASGLIDKVSVPNGPPLSVIAGERDILFTVDAATGDYISLEWLHTGGSSGLVGCDVIVPALS
jgi:hypothetical protein